MGESRDIRWMAKGRGVGGSTLVPGTSVTVQSRLPRPPHRFGTEKVLPKFLWRHWGKESVPLDPLEARRVKGSAKTTLGALFESTPEWALPEPDKQTGRATFLASAAPSGARSGPIHSAYLFIQEIDEGYDFALKPEGEVSADGVVFKPLGRFKRYKRRKWGIRAATDPAIAIRVIQGRELLQYLVAVEGELNYRFGEHHGVTTELATSEMGYFVSPPWGDQIIEAFVGPDDPINVAIDIPVEDGIKTAFALEVKNRADGSFSRTEPLFATALGEDLVISDLPTSLLREAPRALLSRLASYGEDLDALARSLRQDVDMVWAQLTDAAEELGVVSVGEAALLIGRELGKGEAEAPAPVPV